MITNCIEIIDLALYIKRHDALIISDLHIGYGEALNKQGILIPRFSFKDMTQRLNKILCRRFSKIIINGDLKHEFGVISSQEWNETKKIIDRLKMHTKNIILIKGNHDTILEPIAKEKGLKITQDYSLGSIFITHGHIIPKSKEYKNAKTIIIAHEHPAISIREKFRAEKFKCFLKGKYKNKELIVMPSFNPIYIGTDIMKEKLLSPFLKQDLSDFDAYIIEDKVYHFGKIKDIRIA